MRDGWTRITSCYIAIAATGAYDPIAPALDGPECAAGLKGFGIGWVLALDALTLVIIPGTLLFEFCALIFVVVAAIMIPIHIVADRRAGVSARFGRPGMATREGTVVANGARELLGPLTVGMNMIPSMQVTAVDPGGLVVLARRGWSCKRFGERIRVDLRPTGTGRTEVQVESRSTARPALLDFGRNAENVSLVLATLRPQPSLR